MFSVITVSFYYLTEKSSFLVEKSASFCLVSATLFIPGNVLKQRKLLESRQLDTRLNELSFVCCVNIHPSESQREH